MMRLWSPEISFFWKNNFHVRQNRLVLKKKWSLLLDVITANEEIVRNVKIIDTEVVTG